MLEERVGVAGRYREPLLDRGVELELEARDVDLLPDGRAVRTVGLGGEGLVVRVVDRLGVGRVVRTVGRVGVGLVVRDVDLLGDGLVVRTEGLLGAGRLTRGVGRAARGADRGAGRLGAGREVEGRAPGRVGVRPRCAHSGTLRSRLSNRKRIERVLVIFSRSASASAKQQKGYRPEARIEPTERATNWSICTA